MTPEELFDVAEGDEHAAWVLENHLPERPGAIRTLCTICGPWYPCAKVEMAALAVLNRQRAEKAEAALEAATAENQRLAASLEACSDALVRVMNFRVRDPSASHGIRHPLDSLDTTSVVELGVERNPGHADPLLVQVHKAEATARHLLRERQRAALDGGSR